MMPLLTASLAASTAAAAGVLSYGLFHPRSQVWGKVLWQAADRAGPQIALTFDDGPHPLATPPILRLLQQYNAPATFFVIGRHAQAHPSLLRAIHQQGHLLGNHTFDHHHYGTLRGRAYWVRQLQETNDLIEKNIGRRPALFRPPMGFHSPSTMAAARQTHMHVVSWSRSARDGKSASAERIIHRLQGRCNAGDILTLHDGVDPWLMRDWQPIVQALPRVLDHLRQAGLSIVPLDQLLGVDAYQPSPIPFVTQASAS